MKGILTSEFLPMLHLHIHHIGREFKNNFNTHRIIIPNKMQLFKSFATIFIPIILVMQISCSDKITGDDIESVPGEWTYISFEDKIAYSLVLDGTVIYSCAGKDGLWRKDIAVINTDWQYLGLADSSGVFPPMYTVSDVDIYNDTLLVAMYWLNEREEYKDVGIWKSTNNGLTWNRSDSGIASSNWPFSSMWSVKRSPYNPQLIISTVGTNFRSSDGGMFWYQVYPTDAGSETFITKISWHPLKENEVWVYGQGNIFAPMLEVSRDGGITWDDRWNNGITGLNLGGDAIVLKIAFDAIKENILYLACDFGILRSSSSGEDWLNQNWQTPPYILSSNGEFAFTGLATHPIKTGEAYFACGNNLYFTKNFGDNFLINKIPNNSIARNLVYCQALDMIIIGTNSGIIGFKIER